MLGRDDYDDFKECVGQYNYNAEQKLGITVSAIPTKKAVEKHRAMIQKELLSYFYKKELQTIFDEKEIMNMKERFEKNYVVLISNANFSKSLISSEWYYTLQVKTDAGIEQTAIVAGYLKSIEQLLFSILLVLSENENNKFMFYANQEGREKTGQKNYH
jgi:adenosylcobinamide amidohydrolase